MKNDRETISVVDTEINFRRTLLTEDKLDDAGVCLENSPQKSLSKLAQQVGVSISLIWEATKVLELRAKMCKYEKFSKGPEMLRNA